MLIVKTHLEDSTASVSQDMREMECNVKVRNTDFNNIEFDGNVFVFSF